MNALAKTFNYQSSEVRTLVIDGEPWFVASDVCAILDIAKTDRAVARLEEDEKGTHTVRTPGGLQEVTIISEPGMYSLVGKSRKPEAKTFKRWLNHDVLPEIRKTGKYAGAPLGISTDPILATLGAIAEMRQNQLVMEQRVTRIEEFQHQAQEAILALPAATVEVRELSTREKCREAMANLVKISGIGFHDLWVKVYAKYDLTEKVCLTKRATSAKMDKLAYVEKHGNIDRLYAIIRRMLDDVSQAQAA